MYLLFAVLYIPGEGFRPHQQQQTVGLPGTSSKLRLHPRWFGLGEPQNNDLHDGPSLEKVGWISRILARPPWPELNRPFGTFTEQ